MNNIVQMGLAEIPKRYAWLYTSLVITRRHYPCGDAKLKKVPKQSHAKFKTWQL